MSALHRLEKEIDWISGHHYEHYDSPQSKSVGAKAVMKADIEYALNVMDELSTNEMRAIFAGKDSDEFQILLNQLERHTEGMDFTVFKANVKLLILNPIKSGLWKAFNVWAPGFATTPAQPREI
jgi:hypothetical protein